MWTWCPAYDPGFFRVAEPKEPLLPASDLNYLVSFNQKRGYNFMEVLARIFDNSEHMEFRPGYGPEVYRPGKDQRFSRGSHRQYPGILGQKYPEYAPYPGVGGKLLPAGLIKMNEFVTLCGRDRVPFYGSRIPAESTWET